MEGGEGGKGDRLTTPPPHPPPPPPPPQVLDTAFSVYCATPYAQALAEAVTAGRQTGPVKQESWEPLPEALFGPIAALLCPRESGSSGGISGISVGGSGCVPGALLRLVHCSNETVVVMAFRLLHHHHAQVYN